MGVSGQAILHCVVSADGSLSCYVASENPPDQSFGAAALALSKLIKMGPVTRDGAPTAGGEINIPIRFRVPGAP
jgi:TonB family protein